MIIMIINDDNNTNDNNDDDDDYDDDDEEEENYLSLVVRKPVFGVSDQVPHKPGCTSTEDG